MSFRLSSGTLDTMAGAFAPSRKHRPGSGGGRGGAGKSGGTLLGFTVASMFPQADASPASYRPPAQTKRAFGGGTQAMVSRRAIATMERTARRVPEVMVRVTGRQHGGGHVLANFSYISRLGHGPDKQLGLETSVGDVIHDGREMQLLAKEWHEWEMGDDSRRKGATSLSMILSMPTGTDPEQMKAAALEFAREEFANRSWVASLHVDRDHPHVHLTIARRDHDGRRYHPDREDLFRWRQRFAAKLRDRGIEANATPVKARGIDATHEHIAARKVRAKGAAPRLDRSRADRVGRYREAGRSDPVELLLRERRAIVRAAYERSIAELSASPSMVNQTVAGSLQQFVDGLPEPEPNAIRARREMRTCDAEGRPAPSVSDGAGAEQDVLAASLGRLRAAQARSRNAGTKDVAFRRSGESNEAPRPGLSDGLSVSLERSDLRAGATARDRTSELLREVQERDQVARNRDRDRPPEKGGPRR